MKLDSRLELDSSPGNVGIDDGASEEPYKSEKCDSSIPEPDGYYGWVIVFMSTLVMFIVYGTVYSYGVLLLHYIDAGVGSHTVLSFIPGIYLSSIGLLSIITGNIDTRFGHQWCIFIGGIGCASGMFLSSFATETWHLMLTQGLMMGMFGSLTYIGALAAPLQWFDKRRGLACGLTMAGSGIGGLTLPPLFRYLLPILDIEWTLRSYSFFILITLLIASFIIKERIPIGRRGVILPGGQQEVELFRLNTLVDFSLFKDAMFLGLLFGVVTFTMGFMVPILMIGPYAISKGVNVSRVPSLISLINGCSAIGRIVIGTLGDRLGPINMLTVCMMCTSLSCLVIWTLANSYATLLLFSGVYGLAMGGFISMPPVIAYKLFSHKGISKVNGLLFFVSGIPNLVGTPIASALVDLASYQSDPTGRVKNYLPAILYSGSLGLLSCAFFLYLGFRVRHAAHHHHNQPQTSPPIKKC